MNAFDLSDCAADALLMEDLAAETFPSTRTEESPVKKPYDPEACKRVDDMKRALAAVGIFAALRRMVEMAQEPARGKVRS